jgi:hypothetical protein
MRAGRAQGFLTLTRIGSQKFPDRPTACSHQTVAAALHLLILGQSGSQISDLKKLLKRRGLLDDFDILTARHGAAAMLARADSTPAASTAAITDSLEPESGTSGHSGPAQNTHGDLHVAVDGHGNILSTKVYAVVIDGVKRGA